MRPSRGAVIGVGLYLLVLLPALLLPLPTRYTHPRSYLMEFRASRPWLSRDAALNVAIFVPLGWLLVRFARESGLSRVGAIAFATGTGFALSFSAETVQFFVPSRYSSAIDVVTNTGGALIGAVAYVVRRR